MTIYIRFLVVCFVLVAMVACATTKPPAADAERIKAQFTDAELAKIRLVYVEEHGLVLTVPKRWRVNRKELRNKSQNRIRLALRDLSGRNAHGIIWILNDAKGFSNVRSWALPTMRNKTNSYNYASNVAQLETQAINVGAHAHVVRGWRARVAVLGNFRDMALFYAERPASHGPDKWLVVFMRNEGAHRALDMEDDIKDIATPIFASFLDGAQDGTYVVE